MITHIINDEESVRILKLFFGDPVYEMFGTQPASYIEIDINNCTWFVVQDFLWNIGLSRNEEVRGPKTISDLGDIISIKLDEKIREIYDKSEITH